MSEPVAWRVATGRITTGFGWLLFDDLGEAQSYCDDDEPEPLYPADEIERLTQQRDELVAICKSVVERGIGASDIRAMEAAIAKAESS